MWLRVALLLGIAFIVVETGRDYVEGDPILLTPFEEAAQTHNRICARDYTCAGWEAHGSDCCGSCTCDIYCRKYGSCCLRKYDNFTHGQDSVQNTRYSCVVTQYLPEENTDFITGGAMWMVTKCDPESLDTASAELCTQPGELLETVVPVTDPFTNTHYRNRYCAYCNGVAKGMPLINWRLQIQSNRHLSFPDDDFLQKLRATRGNVFFKEPEYVHTVSCKPTPEYTIATCNKTGLWIEYDETTQAACDSFVDPFNYTYKNYFCYVCNTAAPESLSDMVCPFKPVRLDPLLNTPQFVAEVDMDIISYGYNQENLICEATQLRDDSMMECRDVFCHEHRELRNGMCIRADETFSETCFSLFIKMTPLPTEKPVKVARIDKETLRLEIESSFKAGHVTVHPVTASERPERAAESKNTQEFLFFYKESKAGYLGYVIVYINTVFQNSGDKNEFLDDLMRTKVLDAPYIWETEHVIAFSIELAVYNFTMSGQTIKVLIPNSDKMSVDELSSDVDGPDAGICRDKEIVQLNLLHWCPYIKLDMHQLSVKIERDLLHVSYIHTNNVIKVITKWKYELHDDITYICLDDYLDIYYVINKVKADVIVSSRAVSHTFRHMCIFVIICFFV